MDVKELPQGLSGFMQLGFLGGVYFCFLVVAAGLISDGADLLMLLPAVRALAASLLVPVAGALPDGEHFCSLDTNGSV